MHLALTGRNAPDQCGAQLIMAMREIRLECRRGDIETRKGFSYWFDCARTRLRVSLMSFIL
jgi:hypothetical protein